MIMMGVDFNPVVHLAENFCPCTTGSSFFPSLELLLFPHIAQAVVYDVISTVHFSLQDNLQEDSLPFLL